MHFIHQPLTWGFFLVLVPLLIHLINMLRHRRVKWAAMEFLLQSYKKHRKWIWLKQLLLLLLRMAAVAVLVAMLAQWVTRGQWLDFLGGKATHHYVLLDDSYSMSDRAGGTSAFETALTAIQRIAAQAAAQDTPQKFTLIRFSRAGRERRARQDANLDRVADFNAEVVDPHFDVTLANKRNTLQVTELAPRPVAGPGRAGAVAGPGGGREPRGLPRLRFPHRPVGEPGRDPRPPAADRAVAGGDPPGRLRQGDAAEPGRGRSSSRPRRRGAAGVPLFVNVAVKNFSRDTARNVQLKVNTVFCDPELERPPRRQVRRQGRGAADGPDRDDRTRPDRDPPRAGLLPQAGPAHGRGQPAGRSGRGGQSPLVRDRVPGARTRAGRGRLAPAAPSLFPASRVSAGRPGQDGHPAGDQHGRLPARRRSGIAAEVSGDLPAGRAAAGRSGGRESGSLRARRRRACASSSARTSDPAFYTNRLYRGGQGLFPLPLGREDVLLAEDAEHAPDIEVTDHPVFNVFLGERNSFIRQVTIERFLRPQDGWKPAPDSTVRGRRRACGTPAAGGGTEVRRGPGAGLPDDLRPGLEQLGQRPELRGHGPAAAVALWPRPSGRRRRGRSGAPIAVQLEADKFRQDLQFIAPGETPETRSR